MKRCGSAFYSSAYLKFTEETENVKLRYFKFVDGENLSYFPHILEDGVLSGLRYGGIYTNCQHPVFLEKVKNEFEGYCRSNNVRKVCIRENPFVQTVKIGDIVRREPFVYINLTKTGEELRRGISRSHTKCIQNAVRQGLVFEEVKDLKYLKIFYKFYKDVLTPRGVDIRGFSYFTKIFLHLKKYAQLVCVRHKKMITAVSIILKFGPDVFMTHGGMREEGYRNYAKHFMIYNLIFTYKKKGCQRLILGAGHEGQDSIYNFKKGFSHSDKEVFINTYERLF